MENKVDAKVFLKNLLGFSLSSWIGFLISFITIPIITRMYIPETLGKINMFMTVVNLGCIIILCGLDQAYTRFYYEKIYGIDNKQIFSYILFFTTILTFIVASCALPWKEKIAQEVVGEPRSSVFYLLILCTFATGIMRLYNLNYRMKQDFIRFSIQSILIILFSKVVYVACSFWDETYFSAIVLNTIAMLSLMVVYFMTQKEARLARKEKWKWNKDAIKSIFCFGLPLIPVSIITWLNNSLSNFIIKDQLDFNSLGIYTSALSIASLINIVQGGFNTYWTAFVYENYKTEKRKIAAVHNYITFIMVLLGLGIIFFQDIIFLLLGEAYRSSSDFFAFLLIAPLCYTISESTGIGINLEGKTYLNIIFIVGSILSNVVGCYLLIPRFGAVGAAIASAVSGIVYLILRTILGERYFRCVTSYKRSILAISLMIFGCFINLYLQGAIVVRNVCIGGLLLFIVIMYKKEFVRLIELGIDIMQGIKVKGGKH